VPIHVGPTWKSQVIILHTAVEVNEQILMSRRGEGEDEVDVKVEVQEVRRLMVGGGDKGGKGGG